MQDVNPSEVSQEVGKLIRIYRKKNQMSLDTLSKMIGKSAATLSKYETGDISLDLETLYHIAYALDLHVDQLFFYRAPKKTAPEKAALPSFFKTHWFYGYMFDGYSKRIIRYVFEISPVLNDNRFKLLMYRNFRNYDNYRDCESVYWGYMEHFDTLTIIQLTNDRINMDRITIQVLSPFSEEPIKIGLYTGLSLQPVMPISTKILLSQQPQKENPELIQQLKIDKDMMQIVKMWNTFSVL